MRFAIRDDDPSYFTEPEELQRVWGRTLPYAPVSLAVTPSALAAYHMGDREKFHQAGQPRFLGDNTALVGWMRSQVAAGRLSILCHGYTHEYQRLSRRELVPEYVWKPYARLAEETGLARRQLESALGVEVRTFVPPGNAISRAGLTAVRPHFPNVLAAVSLRRWRDLPFERDALAAWARRAFYQLRHGVACPWVERFAGVRLMASHSLTSRTSWESIRAKFDLHRRLGADFIVAVHYWELRGSAGAHIERLLDYAAGAGCRFTHCQDLFSEELFREDSGGEAAPRAGQGKEKAWAGSRTS